MSDERSPEHRSAVSQMANARERALETIHAVRAESMDRASTNLIRTAATPHIAAEATQSVCDYLTHLRTFAGQSEHWNSKLGVVEIPEAIEVSAAGLKRGVDGIYRCTRMPYLNINDMGAAIRAGNAEIVYARGSGGGNEKLDISSDDIYRVEGHDLTAAGFRQYQQGESVEDCEHRGGLKTEFEPASRGEDEQHYQFVYTAKQLLLLYEIADNVADEAGKLGDIEEQPTQDQEGF